MPPIKINRHINLKNIAARVSLGLLLCLGYSLVLAGDIRKIEINQTTLYYHYYQSDRPASKLIVFLHGAVAAYQGQTESTPKDIAQLLESNNDFITTLNESGYDVLLPIAYNDYNWLSASGELYLDSLLGQYRNAYSTLILAGFSDGATGAYKYFYTHPDAVNGLWLFNGYPQHQNFNRKVNPSTYTGYNILYVAQENDKVIPYEFLLTEYKRQKITNAATYFMLLQGKHEFSTYTKSDFEKCLSLLEYEADDHKMTSDSTWIYPPADGYLVNNKLLEIYSIRSSVARNFGMDKQMLETIQSETRLLEALSKQGEPEILPRKISMADLTKDNLDFTYTLNGIEGQIRFQNYLIKQIW